MLKSNLCLWNFPSLPPSPHSSALAQVRAVSVALLWGLVVCSLCLATP